MCEYAALTDRGRVRSKNEDRYSAHPNQGLFIVSDGIGGAPAGEVAAQIVVDTLPRFIHRHLTVETSGREAAHRLQSSIAALSESIQEGTSRSANLSGMGATVVLALVRGATAVIAHVGDSRAYLWRGGVVTQLTRDHSLAQALVDARELTSSQAATHPSRRQVTRYMGMRGHAIADVQPLALRPGDRLLLCTDGLTGMIDDSELAVLLREHDDPEKACRALVDAANDAGGRDNITVVVVAPDLGDRST